MNRPDGSVECITGYGSRQAAQTHPIGCDCHMCEALRACKCGRCQLTVREHRERYVERDMARERRTFKHGVCRSSAHPSRQHAWVTTTRDGVSYCYCRACGRNFESFNVGWNDHVHYSHY